jgi:hypothetical protein
MMFAANRANGCGDRAQECCGSRAALCAIALLLWLCGAAVTEERAAAADADDGTIALGALVTPPAGWHVRLPGEAERSVAVTDDWSSFGRLTFDIQVDPAPPKPLRVMVSLVVGDDWWYQSAELAPVAGTRPRRIELDLGHLSGDWAPRGHLRPWDGYAKKRVRRLAISLFSSQPYSGYVHIIKPHLTRLPAEPAPGRRVFDAGVLTREPRAGQPIELGFKLTWPYQNPFRRGLAHVSLTGEGGATARVPAFFYQGYRQRDAERLKPVGPAGWRARFVPPKPGTWRWSVTALHDGERVTVAVGEFDVKPALAVESDESGPTKAELRPFVLARRVKRRTLVFELVGNEWQVKTEQQATPLVRAWRVPLEWTDRWGRYHGLGRYNLEAAWAFEQVLRKAEKSGLSMPLALNADESFGGQGRFNWFSNPLAREMGGPLSAPSDYFRQRKALELFARQVAYIGARWATSPAVSRFELWMTVPANEAEQWHEAIIPHLRAASLADRPVVSRHPQGRVLGERRLISGFDQQWEDWKPAERISPSTRIEAVAGVGTEGPRRQALGLKAGFPGEAAIFTLVKTRWHGYGRLAFDVYVPKGAPNDMRAMVYVRERDWWWYETLCPTLLRPGDWTKLIVDISPDSDCWSARGHKRPWDGYVAGAIREMGIRIFGHKKYDGAVYLDNIQLWPDPDRPERTRLTYLTVNTRRIGQYDKFEMTFRLNRTFANPFDPAEADVRGHFISPSGKHVTVPGFFHYPYERHQVDGREKLSATGRSSWKVRFAARETGRWTVEIQVNGKRLPTRPPITFEVVKSSNPGYVRRSVTDPQYFEFTGGRFFYPMGHNLRSPSDGRRPYDLPFELPEGQGTFVYDEYFRKMAAAGENTARIWMCPWWCGLEWKKEWPGFGGVGVYSMENAWRLDHLVEEARRRGIYIMLDTTNHGQYSTDIDHEWENNPYNVENGGFLKNAKDFFTDERAKKKYRHRMRYTIARWGYSTSIMTWTLFSEVEFTEEYWQYARHGGRFFSPRVGEWHAEMARYIKALDPFNHLITTHVSHAWRGRDIWTRPEIELTQTNAYSAYPELGQVDVVRTLYKVYHDKHKRYEKPTIIAEYGGHWMKNSAAKLDAELHCGLWATAMMPYAGNTGFWWWLHVHFADKYDHYRALANFMRGEDRRGLNLVQSNLLVRSPGDVLEAVGLQNETRADAWVYHERMPRKLTPRRAIAGGRLRFTGLKDGTYSVEFWDTHRGARAGTATAEAMHGKLTLKLPVVKGDLALKLRLRQAASGSPSG